MKIIEMEADLYCVHCEEEVSHKLAYINNRLSHVECEMCQRVVEMSVDVTREMYKELYERISTKPTRITEEYRKDLSHFLLSFPLRVVSKPFRVLKEIHDTRKIVKNYKW